MSTIDLSAEVSEVLQEGLGVDADEVTPEATLISLGAESIDVLDIPFRLQAQFGIKILEEDFTDSILSLTVSQLEDFVRAKIADKL